MRRYGHVLRKEGENVIMKVLKFKVSSSGGRPKQTWKKQVENEMRKNGLVKEDACCSSMIIGLYYQPVLRSL